MQGLWMRLHGSFIKCFQGSSRALETTLSRALIGEGASIQAINLLQGFMCQLGELTDLGLLKSA